MKKKKKSLEKPIRKPQPGQWLVLLLFLYENPSFMKNKNHWRKAKSKHHKYTIHIERYHMILNFRKVSGSNIIIQTSWNFASSVSLS